MSNLLKKIFGVYDNSDDIEDARIVDSIKSSNLKTMRVIGRGTLFVDPSEVRKSQKFIDQASEIRKAVGVKETS